jgi:hypothetical protein
MKLRRELGFWRALGSLRLGELLASPEVLWALLLGAGGATGLLFFTHVAERRGMAGDFLLLLGPLVGVVLAGLALVIALMSDSYLRLLSENKDGVLVFVRPFIIAIGVQIGALLGAVIYRIVAVHLPHRVEEVAFVVLCFLFVAAVLEVVALTRNLFGHAILRAAQTATDEAEGQVTQIRERRSS